MLNKNIAIYWPAESLFFYRNSNKNMPLHLNKQKVHINLNQEQIKKDHNIVEVQV